MKSLLMLLMMLAALPVSAQVAMGEVITVSGRCFGGCNDDILATRHEIDVISRDGRDVRRVYSDFVQLPREIAGVVLPYRVLYAPGPNRIYMMSEYGELYVSSDFRTASALSARVPAISAISPMKSGNLLVATMEEDLYEITPGGEVVDVFPRAFRAFQSIDLLADQCTVLYAPYGQGWGERRVGRFNRCTRSAMPDFATGFARPVTGVRALPNGDVLVSTWHDVYRFHPNGMLVSEYGLGFVSMFTLSPAGDAIWATRSFGDYESMVEVTRVSLTTPDRWTVKFPHSNTAMELASLAVVGEWRASMPPRGRVVRR